MSNEQKNRETATALLNLAGALAELEGLHFKKLMEQGFTRPEALILTQTYLECQFPDRKKK